MERVRVGGSDLVTLAVVLSTLVQHVPAAVAAEALDLVRPRLDEGDWAWLMAAIAPIPPVALA